MTRDADDPPPLTMRWLQRHGSYVLGLALFATAVGAPMQHVARAVTGMAGFGMFISGAIIELRGAQPSQAGLLPPPQRSSVISRWMRVHPKVILSLAALIAAAGTGYLWAIVFGDGLHGVKDSAQLDRSTTYPDANAALIAAVGAWIAGTVLALDAAQGRLLHRRAAYTWAAATISLGAVAFAIERLVT